MLYLKILPCLTFIDLPSFNVMWSFYYFTYIWLSLTCNPTLRFVIILLFYTHLTFVDQKIITEPVDTLTFYLLLWLSLTFFLELWFSYWTTIKCYSQCSQIFISTLWQHFSLHSHHHQNRYSHSYCQTHERSHQSNYPLITRNSFPGTRRFSRSST